MKPSTVTILATDRIRQRFSKDFIQHFVDRSLHKMSQCPQHVGVWVSDYRTVYGEVTVVYAKDVQTAKVAYRDEVPQEIREGGGYRSDYKLTEDESKKQIQAMWQATGGDFHAGHKDVSNDGDLVSAAELANDPFLNDIERWYKELEASPDRFRIAVVAYHWDGETYHYAPILASVGDISEYGPLCRELFKTAYKKFVEEIPSLKPNILFSSLWVTDDDLDDVRAQFCSCVEKAMAVLAGKDTSCQTQDGIAIFHAASPSLTAGEQFELTKRFDIEVEPSQ